MSKKIKSKEIISKRQFTDKNQPYEPFILILFNRFERTSNVKTRWRMVNCREFWKF